MRRIIPILLAALALAGCSTLPRAVRDDIAKENEKLAQARKDVARAESTVKEDLAKVPDLFNGTAVTTEWPARLSAAKQKLDRADATRRNLETVARAGRSKLPEAERLLEEQHRLRQSALDDTAAVLGEANLWLDFQRNLPFHLSRMNEAHEKLGHVDTAPVAELVAKAEKDWPAKKNDLDSRMNALRSLPERAETQWESSAAAREAAGSGKASGAQIATLIAADSAISDALSHATAGTAEIGALTGQLYDAWDKVLEDLEESESGQDRVYREKVKTVRTHFVDVPLKKTEISSDSKWVEVPASAYRNVEKDLGMAIAHKEAGLYDSEATTVAQPVGFAYMAPPGQSNTYGYWSAGPSGSSVWTWLPQYLIMRELLWGRHYQPIYVNEYNGYQMAARANKSWYGTETPQATPKYGTHGTFTQQSYANSRYVQSGGYRNSSGGATTFSPSRRSSPGVSPDEGRRFGRSTDSPEPGKRFGAPGNSDRRATPSAPPSGRRFGNGGSRPSGGRVFGRRR